MVYRALHRELGTEVAIKEFFPSELALRVDQTVQPSRSEHESPFEDGLRRFVEEAKRLEGLRDCPTIVTCRDLFRANGTAYMVMDYVEGLPLSTLLQRREANADPFNEQDLLEVIKPLLAGLQVVHASGVYHRDIKPSNILIRRADNQPVLIDFGAAKQETAGLTKSMAPYTDGYAAMEQVGEGEIGPWTDVYGVGAVMWRMVAGCAPPFDPPNPVSVQRRAFEVMQGAEDPMPSAVELGSGRFAPNLLETIDSCTRIQPRRRLQSCRDIQERIGNPGERRGIESGRQETEPIRKAFQPATLDPSQMTERASGGHRQADFSEDRSAPMQLGQASEEYAPPVSKLGQSASNWRKVFWIFLALLVICSVLAAAFYGITDTRQGHWDSWTRTYSEQTYHPYESATFTLTFFALMWGLMVVVSGIVWASKASRLAKLESAHAEFKTGLRYARGNGREQDDAEAFRWYLRAAEHGHAEAQFRVSSMYEHGTGVKQDSAKAGIWHSRYTANKFL